MGVDTVVNEVARLFVGVASLRDWEVSEGYTGVGLCVGPQGSDSSSSTALDAGSMPPHGLSSDGDRVTI